VQETTPTASPESEQDMQKRLKMLSKKLRQINMLKEDLANGKQLDDSQMAKIEAEDELLAEMNSLGA